MRRCCAPLVAFALSGDLRFDFERYAAFIVQHLRIRRQRVHSERCLNNQPVFQNPAGGVGLP